MDDSKTRNISTEKLENVLSKLNPKFIDSLPDKPENILKFAKRRTDPVISKNINEELANKMRAYRLSDEDYLVTLFTAMKFVFEGKEKVTNPSASILLSQTGAGKTNLRTSILQRNSNIVILDSDKYKKFRPDEKVILAEDPTHFGALTGIDSYDNLFNIIDFATSMGYNILVECAPSFQQGLVGINIEALKSAGYNIKFHVLAVGNFISSLAIHLRYEKELQAGIISGDVKLTDIKRHDESYMALEKYVNQIDDSMIKIYRRGTEKEGKKPVEITDETKTPLEILQMERKNSNRQYIESGDFKRDNQFIIDSMNLRNAPKIQREQLELIYKRYLQADRENR